VVFREFDNICYFSGNMSSKNTCSPWKIPLSLFFSFSQKIQTEKKNLLKWDEKRFIASERTDQIFLSIASVPLLHHFFPNTWYRVPASPSAFTQCRWPYKISHGSHLSCTDRIHPKGTTIYAYTKQWYINDNTCSSEIIGKNRHNEHHINFITVFSHILMDGRY